MKTEIIAITDRSTSMGTIRDAVIKGFNAFVAEQKGVAGEARMTHVQFSGHDGYKVVYQGVPLEEVVPLDRDGYDPIGSTALHDAIGRTLEQQGKRIHDEGWADQVIVAITTDGEENASLEYTHAQAEQMIAHAKKHGWHFVFLAANQDAFVKAASYGISAATTANFVASAAGAMDAYATISGMTRSLRVDPAQLTASATE